MKIRDSGMPEEAMWSKFFDPDLILEQMEVADIQTPRGPKPDIRPTPEQCIKWSIDAGFVINRKIILQPYHFGIRISKT
jgi:hypothetical protein